MLNVIQKNELLNVLIVVTRYFGGTLLGTGGLVKAYSTSALEAITIAQTIKKQVGYLAKVSINYSDLEQFKYCCKKEKIIIQNIKYLDNIEIEMEISRKFKETFLAEFDKLGINILMFDIISQKYISTP